MQVLGGGMGGLGGGSGWQFMKTFLTQRFAISDPWHTSKGFKGTFRRKSAQGDDFCLNKSLREHWTPPTPDPELQPH